MIQHYIAKDEVEAKLQIEELEIKGFPRENIYVFTYTDNHIRSIADFLQRETGIENKNVFTQVDNIYTIHNPEIREVMSSLGLSEKEINEAECELKSEKLYIVAKLNID